MVRYYADKAGCREIGGVMKQHKFWAYAALACMVMCIWTGKVHK